MLAALELGGAESAVSFAFDRMGVAEEELKRAFRTKKSEPAGAFSALFPHEAFAGKAERVYRSHARELCARMKLKQDRRPGTAAEVLLALSALSLVAPPSQQYAALYERLFAEVMGDAVNGEPTREPWPKASDELLHQMRRKLARDRGSK